jgi:hypothetical protein
LMGIFFQGAPKKIADQKKEVIGGQT